MKSLQANYAKLVKLLLLSVTFFLSCSLSLKNKKLNFAPLLGDFDVVVYLSVLIYTGDFKVTV